MHVLHRHARGLADDRVGPSTQVPLGLWGTVRTIAVTEGVAGFYRGLTPAVLQILPYTGLMYYSYELAKAAIRSAGATGVRRPSRWPRPPASRVTNRRAPCAF